MRLGRSKQWLIAALIGLPVTWFVLMAEAPEDQGEKKENTVSEKKIRATRSLVPDGDDANSAGDGRSMPPLETAPIGAGFSGGDSLVLSACPGERLPIADFSRCEPIRMNFAGINSFDAFVCPEL